MNKGCVGFVATKQKCRYSNMLQILEAKRVTMKSKVKLVCMVLVLAEIKLNCLLTEVKNKMSMMSKVKSQNEEQDDGSVPEQHGPSVGLNCRINLLAEAKNKMNLMFEVKRVSKVILNLVFKSSMALVLAEIKLKCSLLAEVTNRMDPVFQEAKEMRLNQYQAEEGQKVP